MGISWACETVGEGVPYEGPGGCPRGILLGTCLCLFLKNQLLVVNTLLSGFSYFLCFIWSLLSNLLLSYCKRFSLSVPLCPAKQAVLV